MRKKITIVCLTLVAMVSMAVVSACDPDMKHCEGTDSPYWCSSAKVCCAYQYHDGHGTCWSTMSACRSTGYACTACHLED
ncbi:MAG: hypothetical protein IJP80_03470 [Bacteroidales bacterium]|nr:hypothetical protein [Bacteroidales bacterium]